MTWADERRASQAATRQEKRLDAAAAAELRIKEADAAASRRRKDQTADETVRRNYREQRREKRRKLRAEAVTWLAENRVRLTIALLAVASAVMAIPAMASYGYDVYGGATGVVLPVLSELGAWAFTFAVHDARKNHPNRPVWALLLGVWLFALGGAAMNVMHGIGHGPGDAAVMGFAALAGIVAHQLAVASPRRTQAERAEAKLTRLAHRRATRVRRAAIGDAVAEIDAAGTVTLVYAAGRYRIGKHGGLDAIVEPDRHAGDVLAEEIEAFLAAPPTPDAGGSDTPIVDAPVLTLDPPDEQRESGPKPRTIRAPKQRTIGELREAFRKALADPESGMRPTVADSIRGVLRCAPKSARKLRDEYQNGDLR